MAQLNISDYLARQLHDLAMRQDCTLDEVITHLLDKPPPSLAFDHITELVALLDTDLRIIWANQAAATSVNRPPDEMVGQHCYELWQEQGQPCRGCPVLQTFNSGHQEEAERETPDGRSWLIRSSPVYDHNHQLIGAVEVGLDITARKLAETALRESEVTLSSIFRAAPIGIGLVKNRIFTWVNDLFVEMLGYQQAELVGQSARILYHSESEYERVGRVKYAQIHRHGIGTVETQFVCKDGTVLDILLSSSPLDPNDLSLGVTFTALDITHQKKQQQALHESEARYHSIVQHSPDGIILLNEEAQIIEWNQAYEQITGLTYAEVLGQYLWDVQYRLCPDELKSPEIYELSKRNVIDFMTTGQPISKHEMSIQRADEEQRVIQAIATRIKTEHGYRAVSIIRDVTDSKQAEAQLRQRNQELEALLSIATAIGSTRKLKLILNSILVHLGTLVPYDSASIALLQDDRLRLAANIGMPDDATWSRAKVEVDTGPLWSAVLETRQPVVVSDVQADQRWIQVPGLEYIRSWLGVPLVHRDHVIGMLNLDHTEPNYFTKDHVSRALAVARLAATAIENAQLFASLEYRVQEQTAELRAANEQTDMILSHITDGIAFTDLHNRILYVNPAWEAITGYSAEEVLNRRMYDDIVSTDETLEIINTTVSETIQAGQIWQGTLKHRHKNGTLYDAELAIVPVCNKYGDIAHLVEVQRDVTAARQLDAMKTRFIADAAHDLGNPVAVLKFQLDLIQMDPDNAAHYLEVIERQTNRLDALVRDLLLLSRLDRDVIMTEPMPADLSRLVSQVVESQAAMAHSKGIELVFDNSQQLPLTAIDVLQLERVVVNLINNAINYTPTGGTVTISIQAQNNWLVLSIKDTGVGILPQDLPHIFERFYRGENGLKLSDGTGLGLAIVKEIINRHDGKIDVASTPGEGSHFQIHLPVSAPALH